MDIARLPLDDLSRPKDHMGTEGRPHRPDLRLRLGPQGAPPNGDVFSLFFAPFAVLFSLATRRRILEHRQPTGGWSNGWGVGIHRQPNPPTKSLFCPEAPYWPQPSRTAPSPWALSAVHMDSTYLQTVQKTMCKIHIHILSTHSVL